MNWLPIKCCGSCHFWRRLSYSGRGMCLYANAWQDGDTRLAQQGTVSLSGPARRTLLDTAGTDCEYWRPPRLPQMVRLVPDTFARGVLPDD